MLQFLQIVLGDIASSKTKSRDFNLFLDHFLVNIAKCIPHNLHEEIFFVCEQIIHLMKDKLKKNHIETIIDALIDKYTMRSKSHKRLMQSFFDTIISQSLLQLEHEEEQNQPVVP